MLFFILIIGVQVFCIVDVVRHGRSQMWISALIFLPVASTIAYFIVEVLPSLRHNRHVRVARQSVIKKIDPERELRAAKSQLEIADTMANRTRVADALTALGRHGEALPLYQRGAGPRPDFRTGEKLARSLYLNDRPGEALSVLDALPKVTGQSDLDRTALLRARILEDMGRHDEALALKVGHQTEARRVLEDVEKLMKYIDRHTRASNGQMYDWAMKELTGLRT